MTDKISNYKCPACTGPLKFSSETGKLECEYCGSSFTAQEIEELNAKKDEAAAKALNDEKLSEEEQAKAAADIDNAEKKAGPKADTIDWNNAGKPEEWKNDISQMHTYNCPSCGAEVICEETTAATCCPYCGNPSIIPGQMSGTLKPDYIIPFKLNKEAAKTALKNYYNKKWFLPKAFSQTNQIEKIQGLYVPFWFFDGVANGEFVFDATNSTSHREGDYIVTTTRHYRVERNGSYAFERIPTDASQRMPDDLMDSIEPYNYSELTEFSTAYLPGYLADKFDVTMEDSTDRALNRAKNTMKDLLSSTINGYSTITERSRHVDIKNLKVHYAFLPVWLINTKWNDKSFLFDMNGQTGKFVGNLPACPKKLMTLMISLTAGIAAFMYFTGIAKFISEVIRAGFE